MAKKILVIVESPSKCKKIESYLGNNYKCVASFGHIRELLINKGLNCIDKKNNYEPLFKSKNNKNIKILKTEINNASDILLATDDDREGEAIAWHICIMFKLDVKKTKRILFNEITKNALIKAVNNPTTINMNKVNSQKARQVLDLLVGFTISPLLWKHISNNKQSSLSAGRCQTPALRLIYDNYNEIKKDNSEECYEVLGYFTKFNLDYKLNYYFKDTEKMKEFLNKSISHKYIINNENERQIFKKSPIPLTTSSLQQKASNLLNYSPKDTMSVCQKLYEKGYITYMRTDSKTYSKDFINNISEFINDKFGNTFLKEDIFSLSSRNNNKENNAQEAHEAIRPTLITRENLDNENNSKEIKMYKLIWKHTMQTCMKDAKFLKYKSTIKAPLNYVYEYNLEKNIFLGWLILDKFQQNEFYDAIKFLNNKEVNYNKIKCNFKVLKNKQHLNEAKLVSLLEKKGIGRPSTYSSIIAKIKERGYVKRENIKGKEIDCKNYELVKDKIKLLNQKIKVGNEKNKLVLQPIGKIVIEYLINNVKDLFDYEYTCKMEEELDLIGKGEKIWYKLCQECDKYLMEIKDNDKSNKIEYKIDDNHSYKVCRYGPVIIRKKNNKTEYLKVKESINLEKIKELNNNDKLVINEIIEENKNNLGSYKGKDVILKKGKFGLYISYDNKNYSIKGLEDITLDNVIPYIENKKSNIKVINENISIRNGKFGKYIYYKSKTMKRPIFINKSKISIDYEKVEYNDKERISIINKVNDYIENKL